MTRRKMAKARPRFDEPTLDSPPAPGLYTIPPRWRRPSPWGSYMSRSMFVRYMWWVHSHVCHECGEYHSKPS